jgi:hypothetical protein
VLCLCGWVGEDIEGIRCVLVTKPRELQDVVCLLPSTCLPLTTFIRLHHLNNRHRGGADCRTR